MPTSDDPIAIRRGDLRGLALETYIPRRGMLVHALAGETQPTPNTTDDRQEARP